jgi:sec-independent protein translocase protein TatB
MFPEGRIFELVIVFAVALIVVGPKDLPIMMRKVGRFVAHMRGMAAEFRASFDEMARQTELDELRKEVEAMKSGRSVVGLEADPHTQGVFDDIHASLRSDGSTPPAPAPAMTAIEAPTSADEPELPMAMPLAPAPTPDHELPTAQVLS